MRFSFVRLSLLASLGLLLAAPVIPGIGTAAQAQSIQIGPGGVRINPDSDHRRGPGPRWRVSEREAIGIARRRGVVEVNRVVRGDREWRVSGRDRRGNRIRVVINARSGDVIRVVRVR